MPSSVPIRSLAAALWLATPVLAGDAAQQPKAQTVVGVKQISVLLDGLTPAAQEQRVKALAAVAAKIRTCGEVEAVAKTVGAEVSVNYGIPMSIMPQALQDLVDKLAVGTATPLFGEKNKYARTLILCSRD